MSNICRFTAPASRDIESIIDYVANNSSCDAAEILGVAEQDMNLSHAEAQRRREKAFKIADF